VRPPGKVPVRRTTRALFPVDWLTVGYLGITLILLIVFAHRTPLSFPLGVVHVAGIAAIVILRSTALGDTQGARALLAFYPLPLFALLYSEVGILCRLIHPVVFFDSAIQVVETRWFGGEPSQYLHLRWPWPPLGEYLHLGYVSYYTLVPTLCIVLWFTRPREVFDRALATVALVFYVSFLFFIVMPVKGPFQHFGPIDPERLGIILPKVARWVLDRGSSVGAAFPSSHVAVSVATWIMAMRYQRPLAVLYLFLVPALALGAIYGGYHYATDVLAGAVLGVLVGTLGHGLVAWMETWPSRRSRGRTGAEEVERAPAG
jgi:membrane-associated phospholipid phosphatase